MTETEILVIGGGPVGLSTALLLAGQGVQCILVEKNESISNHPKASAFNTRTMEILRQLNIANEVYARTGPVGGVSFYTSLSGYKLGEIKMSEHPGYINTLLASTPSPLTISSQIVLESILRQHADASKSIEVRFATEKLKLTQSENHVDVDVIDHSTNTPSTIRAKYVIACDGAGSPTRKEHHRKMIGPPAFGYQINVYIKADIESLVNAEAHQALYWIATKEASGVFIGLGGDWKHWCFNFSYYPQHGEKIEDFTEEACLNKIQAALGTDKLPVEILSIGPWVLCGQVIDEFREGRVFFGGDAAHLNIPTGGFGFNTGMQEIHNLAWKIAYVLRGIAPDSLLDSYQTERRDIAVFNIETSRINAINIRETGASLGSEVEDADEIEAESEKGKAQRQKRTDAIDRQHNHFMFLGQEIGFGYWDSEIISDDGSLHYVEEHNVEDPIFTYIANARPGARAPHCWVTQAENRISILDLYSTDFTLLFHGVSVDLNKILSNLPENIPVNIYSIGSEGTDSDLIDIHGVWNAYYGIEESGAVLVRPDGHVAWRTSAAPADNLIDDSIAMAIRKSLSLP
jgi:2-polyprenyl-6-methoxyphenol hydroxylase-like FAD-dependent oxidoreductase